MLPLLPGREGSEQEKGVRHRRAFTCCSRGKRQCYHPCRAYFRERDPQAGEQKNKGRPRQSFPAPPTAHATSKHPVCVIPPHEIPTHTEPCFCSARFKQTGTKQLVGCQAVTGLPTNGRVRNSSATKHPINARFNESNVPASRVHVVRKEHQRLQHLVSRLGPSRKRSHGRLHLHKSAWAAQPQQRSLQWQGEVAVASVRRSRRAPPGSGRCKVESKAGLSQQRGSGRTLELLESPLRRPAIIKMGKTVTRVLTALVEMFSRRSSTSQQTWCPNCSSGPPKRRWNAAPTRPQLDNTRQHHFSRSRATDPEARAHLVHNYPSLVRVVNAHEVALPELNIASSAPHVRRGFGRLAPFERIPLVVYSSQETRETGQQRIRRSREVVWL